MFISYRLIYIFIYPEEFHHSIFELNTLNFYPTCFTYLEILMVKETSLIFIEESIKPMMVSSLSLVHIPYETVSYIRQLTAKHKTSTISLACIQDIDGRRAEILVGPARRNVIFRRKFGPARPADILYIR